jgi:C-terminal processing protease CtpA/Prc
LTPNGRFIRKQGIEPDIVVELPAGSDLISPYELREMSLTELLNSEDVQLLKALEVLDVFPPEASIGYSPDQVELSPEYWRPSRMAVE